MWVSIAIIIVGTEICALALILIASLAAGTSQAIPEDPIAGDIFGVIGTGFAVILAFVIFTAFESYATAREDAGIESVATRQMYSLARFFPAESRDTLEGGLICYSRAVVNDEWADHGRRREQPPRRPLGGRAGRRHGSRSR